MKGWFIFLHAVQMVLRNWREAMKIGLLPVGLMVVLVYFLLSSTGMSVSATSGQPRLDVGQVNAGVFFLLAVIWVFILLWVFVSWHRFVLLEEYPQGWIPPLRPDRILAYFAQSLIVGFAIILMMMPLGLAFLLGPVGVLIFVVGAFLILVIGYRFLVMLPAAAIGKPLSMGAAWEDTRGASGAIVLMLILVGLVQVGTDIVVALAMAASVVLGLVVQMATAMILMLVNVSLLTTLYGHFVQGRPID